MKIIRFSKETLSAYDFGELTDLLSDALYAIIPEIKDIYEIHIDYIADDWHIEFVPTDKEVPVLKVNAYTTYDSEDNEILHIKPVQLIKFSDTYSIDTYSDAMDFANKISTISDFILGLHDFSYKL